MKPTPTQIEAAFDAYLEGVYLTEDQAKASVIRIVTAALSVQPAAAVVGEPVGMGVFRNGEMIGFVGIGDEFNLPEDTDERRPIYAAPSAPDGWQEAARIGDAVLAWMVKYDLLDAGNEYRAEDVLAVLNDFAPEPFPQPIRKDGGEPCGECHIQPGETCDICQAVRVER